MDELNIRTRMLGRASIKIYTYISLVLRFLSVSNWTQWIHLDTWDGSSKLFQSTRAVLGACYRSVSMYKIRSMAV